MGNHLLSLKQHRPWPLPDRHWHMTQTWEELLFIHWSIPIEQIQPLLPSKLELDTYHNEAWVGIVPFTMNNIRLRGLPRIPFTSAFHEMNVRTYVKVGDKAGVYFLSLDAENRLAVEVARTFFHLPYRYAKMDLMKLEGDTIQYMNNREDRRALPAQFRAEYRPVSAPFRAKVGTLEHWLTERYCLYTTNRSGTLMRGDIHHTQWELQHAEAHIKTNSMITASGLIQPSGVPLLHYSKHLEVLLWGLVPAE